MERHRRGLRDRGPRRGVRDQCPPRGRRPGPTPARWGGLRPDADPGPRLGVAAVRRAGPGRHGLVDLISAGGISRVTVAPTGSPSAWDFLIDTVAFNQSVTSIVNP